MSNNRTSSQQDTPQGQLTVRILPMPADTNANGDIFGGWVLSQMDIAGAICAAETAKGRVATVAVEAMNFIAPVKVGDVLSVHTEVERVGRTSVSIHIEAWVSRNRIGALEKVTDGTFVFVAIDEMGKPRPLKGV